MFSKAMLRWTLLAIVCAPAAVLAETPTVRVTCAGGGCTADTALPPGTFHLIVRDPGGLAPHVRVKGGKDRTLVRCPKERTAFCGDVTSAEVGVLWIGGAAIPVAIRVEHGQSFSDIDTARAVSISLYELRMDSGFMGMKSIEAIASTGGGLSQIPQPKEDPHHQPHIATLKGERSSETPLLKEDPHSQIGTPPAPLVHYIPLPLDDGSYPDLVALGDIVAFTCSGTAITRQWVLTARHCGAATRVVVATNVAAPIFDTAVDRVVPAPDPRLDLELLHIARELPVTPHSRRHAGDDEPPSSELRIIGFGISNFASRSGFGVKRAFETSIDGWGCDRDRPRTTGCDPAREFVVPATSGHDTCNGDSGGAVLEIDEAEDEWRLVGITSRADSMLDSGCGQGGIYVRIDVAAAWIDDIVKGQP